MPSKLTKNRKQNHWQPCDAHPNLRRRSRSGAQHSRREEPPGERERQGEGLVWRVDNAPYLLLHCQCCEKVNMKTMEVFDEMITKVISPYLKKMGFQKLRNSFYLPLEGNWGIINFQRSQTSDSNLIIFTVNIGIASKRILQFLGQAEHTKKPDIWDTQWRMRIGHLMPENNDMWWNIDQKTNIDELGNTLVNIVTNYALPAIREFIHDENLRDLWLSGKSPSLTETQRLLYLAILLKQIGPVEILEATLNELQQVSVNKPGAIMTTVYIKKIRGFQD